MHKRDNDEEPSVTRKGRMRRCGRDPCESHGKQGHILGFPRNTVAMWPWCTSTRSSKVALGGQGSISADPEACTPNCSVPSWTHEYGKVLLPLCIRSCVRAVPTYQNLTFLPSPSPRSTKCPWTLAAVPDERGLEIPLPPQATKIYCRANKAEPSLLCACMCSSMGDPPA